MFTGIIKNFAKVNNITKEDNKDLLLEILVLDDLLDRNLEIGCSIACNGICLTLIKKLLNNKNQHSLYFQASNETRNKTTIDNWQKNQIINLEFSLRASDELGGHMVLGHIDEKTQIISITKDNQSHIFNFKTPKNLQKFIVKKGSVTIDGVSLTINETNEDFFSVNIISHTFANTIFKNYKINDFVNLEIDTIAKYLSNYLK